MDTVASRIYLGQLFQLASTFRIIVKTLLPMHALGRYSNGPAHLHCSRRTGHFDLDHSRGASPRVGVANRGNKAVSSVTLRQSYRLTRKRSRGTEQLSTSRTFEPQVMETTEVILCTFIGTHYFGTILFYLWLLVCGTPTELTNYGLLD